MRVFTTEGRRSAENLFRFACSQWPEGNIAVVDICFPYFAKNYQYPRTLRYQDLPIVRAPQYKLSEPNPEQESKPIELLLRFDGVVSERYVPTISDLSDLCSNATSVTFADRLFYQPAMTFQLFVEHFMPHLADTDNLVLDTWHSGCTAEESLTKSLDEGMTTSDLAFSAAIGAGRAKRYFDYNYHLNGNIVFGDLYRKLSGSAAPIHMSKNMVLVLYMIRKLGSVERWGFEHIMSTWRGWKREGDGFEIGTVPSRQMLVPNLVMLGLVATEKLASKQETVTLDNEGRVIKERAREYHSLTSLGERFLECLHPDCYDPFQPRRIDTWQKLGFSEAMPQIDRYIKTYFGKQIRFQSKLFRV
jgi:hypothetical protein